MSEERFERRGGFLDALEIVAKFITEYNTQWVQANNEGDEEEAANAWIRSCCASAIFDRLYARLEAI